MPDPLIVHAGVHRLADDDRFCDWLREHDVQPENTYRTEIGDRSMRVYQFAVNDEGRKYVVRDEHGGGTAALREPFDVQLKSRPEWLDRAREVMRPRS